MDLENYKKRVFCLPELKERLNNAEMQDQTVVPLTIGEMHALITFYEQAVSDNRLMRSLITDSMKKGG